jgi:hypothetical protein
VPAARFPIRIGPRSRLLLRILFGVRADNAFVELGDVRMSAGFGRFWLSTPLANIVGWRIEGPWLWITAIGPRTSLRHRDLTFGGNHRGGVRMDFREPVPFLFYRVTALYATVENLGALGRALEERGIPHAPRAS